MVPPNRVPIDMMTDGEGGTCGYRWSNVLMVRATESINQLSSQSHGYNPAPMEAPMVFFSLLDVLMPEGLYKLPSAFVSPRPLCRSFLI